jgi:hypothetical protein
MPGRALGPSRRGQVNCADRSQKFWAVAAPRIVTSIEPAPSPARTVDRERVSGARRGPGWPGSEIDRHTTSFRICNLRTRAPLKVRNPPVWFGACLRRTRAKSGGSAFRPNGRSGVPWGSITGHHVPPPAPSRPAYFTVEARCGAGRTTTCPWISPGPGRPSARGLRGRIPAFSKRPATNGSGPTPASRSVASAAA